MMEPLFEQFALNEILVRADWETLLNRGGKFARRLTAIAPVIAVSVAHYRRWQEMQLLQSNRDYHQQYARARQ